MSVTLGSLTADILSSSNKNKCRHMQALSIERAQEYLPPYSLRVGEATYGPLREVEARSLVLRIVDLNNY